LDRGNVHTKSETPPYFRQLPVPAAVRLSPVLPIKALDPVGTSSLLLITSNRPKVTENIRRRLIFFSAGQLYYRFVPLEHPEAFDTFLQALGFDAFNPLQVDGFLPGI
jgi:hypothetical protein